MLLTLGLQIQGRHPSLLHLWHAPCLFFFFPRKLWVEVLLEGPPDILPISMGVRNSPPCELF